MVSISHIRDVPAGMQGEGKSRRPLVPTLALLPQEVTVSGMGERTCEQG